MLRAFDDIINMSLREDAPTGDITTLGTINKDKRVEGVFISKDEGVLCGMDIVYRTFELSGGHFEMESYFNDGDLIKKGDIIARINGKALTVLTGERTALNLMQRASGISTATRLAVQAVEGTRAKITDTRKTMPGLRALDKYAIRVGGGINHRFNLSDGVLIKDNHITAAGSIATAVERAKANCPHNLKIEVETETLDQVLEALDAGADIIMLDNMTIENMKKAVIMINDKAVTEASGNMGEKDLAQVASTGVNLISMGSLTHSVKALDISLKLGII